MHIQSSRERGVILIYTLIILLILTIGAAALVRSMHTSLFTAGNLAFRRDLVNQGEQAVSNSIAAFETGAFSTPGSTQADIPTANYSSTMLPTNAQGVPNVLLNDNAFGAVYNVNNDIINAPAGITIRYVIDRLCDLTGASLANHCVQSSSPGSGHETNNQASLPPASATVYRVSVRVKGPRSTQVFLQSTFTKPD